MANMFKFFSLVLFSYIASFIEARLLNHGAKLSPETNPNRLERHGHVIKEGEVESFRPTTPGGHSPGIGHSLSPLANVATPSLLSWHNVIHDGEKLSPETNPSQLERHGHVIKEGEIESFRPTTPGGHSPGIGHSLSPHANVASPSLLNNPNVIPDGDVDSFRHTTQGHSPGIGHSLKNDASPALTTKTTKANVESPAQVKRHPFVITEGNIESFRPTTPGHSPGMGHSLSHDREEMAKINANATSPSELKKQDFHVTDEGNVESFSPTSPGHSPGIGHSKHD